MKEGLAIKYYASFISIMTVLKVSAKSFQNKELDTVEYITSFSRIKEIINRYGITNTLRAAFRSSNNFNFSTFGLNLLKSVYTPKTKKTVVYTAIEITNRCPYNCRGCYIDPQKKQTNYIMPEALLRKTINELSYSALILIQGGEPFANDTVDMIYRVLRDYPDQAFILVTNGVYISKNGIGDFAQLNNIVWTISINGTEGVNDQSRFSGGFKCAIKAMQLIREAQQYFTPVVTVSKRNIVSATSEEFVTQMANLGAKEIKYLVLKDPSSGEQLTLKELNYFDEYTKKYNKYLFTTFTRYEFEGFEIIDPYGIRRKDRTGNDNTLA
jgi:MoaA/NifB/PqqE/SkfB family radical SAM enzyme